ncbi:MetQ/NlpA family ABC transporter substrate-binding protein [Zhihengliuella salsuginis]|uniref:Lipoprotein n=1 Tax=Zhihengliuella salsuginis TaxID=578222 RepID=A0ABQ3GGG2_9MICC|nr:MetQ/NlpA family ABC transporter substrate-binding protein [Zhihengliuella salsuginis]GHD03697.1 lipoprotein [Zhihengliuella salsuginis]
MRKKLSLAATGAVALFALTACGGDTPSAEENTNEAGATILEVGAVPVPHAEILEYVDENLAADAGIDLEIQEFDDYQTPNIALDEGSIDVNYYQHLPWLEEQMATKGYEFEHGAGIHIEPYSAFSKHETVEDIPDGGVVAITNDPANQLRALYLLEEAGLLQDIDDETTALSITDEQNPKGLEFEENQPEVLVQISGDPQIDLAILNGNYLLQAGMKTADALLVEDVSADNQYANFLAWRAGESTEAIETLEELMQSDEVKEYIKETWPNGDVTPTEAS